LNKPALEQMFIGGIIQKIIRKKIKKFFFKRRNLFTFGEYSIVRTKNNYLKGEMTND